MLEAPETERGGRRGRTPRRERDLLWRRAIAFAVAAGLVLIVAFNGGGYDLVVRQEVAMAVCTAIALGFAFGVLPRAQTSQLGIFTLAAFGALAALTAVAFAWTESDERTLEEVARVVGYGGFVVLAYLGVSRYTARAAAAGVATAVLIVPIFSIVSRLSPETLTDEAVTRLFVDRLSYPLGYWNALACWGAIAIAIGLVWSAHARDMRVRRLALAALPFAGLTVYLTYSRAGVIALVIAALAAVAFSRRRWTVALNGAVVATASGVAILIARDQPEIANATGSEGAGAVLIALLAGSAFCALVAGVGRGVGLDKFKLPRQTARIAVAGAAVLTVLVALTAAREPLDKAWDEFRNEDTPTVNSADPAARLTSFGGSRYDVWTSAIDAFESDRAHGVGPGTFEFWWAEEGSRAEFVRDGHSLYLEVLAELGLVGLALLLATLGGLLAVALAARRKLARTADVGAWGAMTAAFAVFAFYAFVDWIWEVPAIAFVGLAGIAIAGAAGFDRWGQRPLSVWIRAGAVTAALLAAAVQVPGVVSTDRIRASATALRADDTDLALELSDEAIDAQPYAASPYVQRALAHEDRGELDAARADLEDAVEREPVNWRHHLLLARLAARSGDAAEMRRQLGLARGLAPRSSFLVEGTPFQLELQALLANSRR